MDRYYSFNAYLKGKYGVRVQRIPVNLGLGCPHRINGIGPGGCIYCDYTGSGVIPSYVPIEEQIRRGIEFAEKRYKAKLFMVYFQAFSNTYAPVERLEELYRRALIDPRIVGLMVGTRPDLLPEEVLDLLESFAKAYEVWVEVGLQSAHYRTLKLINRGHGVSHFVDAVLRIKKRRGVLVGTHVILGLPGEDLDDMVETARFLSALPVDGVKIHSLHVLKNTPLEDMYNKGELFLFTMDEYVNVCVAFLEHLRSDIVVQRLTGEAPADRLVAPVWCLRKSEVINCIKKRLEELDTFQGAKVRRGYDKSDF